MSAVDRSIKNIQNELEFLRDEKVISGDQLSQILGMLKPSQEVSGGGVSSQGERLVAQYDFGGQQPTDLPLHSGDQIELVEKLNNDWWRGKNISSGREGVFPSNYVVPSNGSSQNEKSSYQPNSGSNSGPPSYYVPQPQPYQQQQQQQYAPPQQSYQPPFYPQQQQQQQQPQQQEVAQQQGGGHNGTFSKIGKRFGDAAIFGAGATLGSDLINKIF